MSVSCHKPTNQPTGEQYQKQANKLASNLSTVGPGCCCKTGGKGKGGGGGLKGFGGLWGTRMIQEREAASTTFLYEV